MRFLLDEMFPRVAAELLREHHGHEAIHVVEVGLGASDDEVIAEFARRHERVIVTENVVDFAEEQDLVLVFLLKRNLPAGGGAGRSARRTPRSLGEQPSRPLPRSALAQMISMRSQTPGSARALCNLSASAHEWHEFRSNVQAFGMVRVWKS